MSADAEGVPLPDQGVVAPQEGARALPVRRRIDAGAVLVQEPPADDAPRALPARALPAEPDPEPAAAPEPVVYLRALPGSAGVVVGPEDVREAGALPPLSTMVDAALTAHLAGLTGTLELALRRALAPRTVVDTCVPDPGGRIYLSASPVRSITQVQTPGSGVVPWTGPASPEAYIWLSTPVVVTYEAGLREDSPEVAAVRGALIRKALPYLQVLLAREASEASDDRDDDTAVPGDFAVPAPVPGIKAFTVEGLNVTFESTNEAVAAAAQSALAVATQAEWTREEIARIGVGRRVVAL